MAVYDRFIISLWVIFALSTVALSAGGSSSWDLYYVLYLMEYLILSALFSVLNAQARNVLVKIASVLIPGFGVVLVLRFVSILSGI